MGQEFLKIASCCIIYETFKGLLFLSRIAHSGSSSDGRENSAELPRKTNQMVLGLDLAEYLAYHSGV